MVSGVGVLLLLAAEMNISDMLYIEEILKILKLDAAFYQWTKILTRDARVSRATAVQRCI